MFLSFAIGIEHSFLCVTVPPYLCVPLEKLHIKKWFILIVNTSLIASVTILHALKMLADYKIVRHNLFYDACSAAAWAPVKGKACH